MDIETDWQGDMAGRKDDAAAIKVTLQHGTKLSDRPGIEAVGRPVEK